MFRIASWAAGLSIALSILNRARSIATRWAPSRLLAWVDHLRPTIAEGFGGPFNGQARRAESIRELFASVRFETIIETGTYRGTTTLFLAQLSTVPVATIELNSRYFHYARRRLRGSPNVTLVQGDSATALRFLATRNPWSQTPAFFYLDAHWAKHLPLREEIEAIRQGWSAFVVVIDDFKVPDDAGYGYDNYGPGESLELAIMAPLVDISIVAYWPAVGSMQETGARRGWIVLASPGRIDDSLRQMRTLRRAGPLSSAIAAAELASVS
jgi:hypothetical protein